MLLGVANEMIEQISFLNKNLLTEKVAHQFVETCTMPLGVFTTDVEQVNR